MDFRPKAVLERVMAMRAQEQTAAALQHRAKAGKRRRKKKAPPPVQATSRPVTLEDRVLAWDADARARARNFERKFGAAVRAWGAEASALEASCATRAATL